MSLRLIIHAGFHKTGTSSVQKTLDRNRSYLSEYLRVFLRPDILSVCEAARAYSIKQDPVDLGLLRFELAQFFESLDPGDNRPVLISSEDLSGHMPGRRGLKRYKAAPSIMSEIDALARQIIVAPQITFFFSTRAAEPWVNSCYAQHVRATRMTSSADAYRRKFLRLFDLPETVEKIALSVPNAAVAHEALETSTSKPLGPLDPVLDLCGIGQEARQGLETLPPMNAAQPQEILTKLLELNRSDMDGDTLRAAKRALLQSRKTG